jgi:hypothetical protein
MEIFDKLKVYDALLVFRAIFDQPFKVFLRPLTVMQNGTRCNHF